MNCQDAHHHLMEAVDRGLSGEPRNALFAHLDRCNPCRVEYELQLLAKQVLSTKIVKASTPDAVRSSILTALEREMQGPTFAGSFRTWFAPHRIALAGGFAAILLAALFFLPQSLNEADFEHTSANDVINRSVQNFSLVRSGEFKPSMIACYPDIVVGFFQEQGVDFAVSIPVDDSCDWYGAVSDTWDGVKQAHIMYKRGDDLLYVYEVSKDVALAGSALTLPAAARKSLAETGWYTDPQHQDCNVVLWVVNETLCAAVSTMNKDRMLAVLTSR